ncbi:MAG: hypothetical protein V7L23_21370 [Nostoc sp.]|uniref:hypothetical protein n=1 Tax=Nostoc sp. TaxID=1180 RepID=UPI002FF26079
MAIKIKEDIKQLYEIRERIVSLTSYHQWVNARDFSEAYRGVDQAITALEKILEDLNKKNENQDH